MAISLHTEDSLRDLTTAVLHPWLAAHPSLPPPGAGKCVVVAPDAVRLAALKRSWLEAGGAPLLDLAFWTPGELRRYLLLRLLPDQRVATAEDLALMVRLVAGNPEEESPRGVVARDPAGFLQAWDQLLGAQAEDSLLGAPWRALRTELEKHLSERHLASVRTVDWRLAELPAATRHPPLGRVLLDGFSALHAPLFPLLLAAVRQSAEATVTFPLPRSRPSEQLWLGTFEALAETVAEPVLGAIDTERPFARWAEAAEIGAVVPEAPPGIAFYLFRERRFEVAALADRIESAVRSTPEARIGVALPNEPLLVRALAAELVRRPLPIHDTFGYFPVAEPAESVFAKWIEWQQSGRLPVAQGFLEALEAAGQLDAAQVDLLQKAWDAARERTGSDDLAVLTAYLRADAYIEGAKEATAWAASWPRLEPRASLPLFLETARAAFVAWGGAIRFDEAAERWREIWAGESAPVDRAVFLEWLFGSLRVPGRARHAAARDAFAPIQFVSYEMVRGEAWTHLFLAGLNEGLVPAPSRESAFLLPDAVATHLRQSRRAGPHGEGDERVAEGRGFLLDERTRRSIQTGLFFDAIAETQLAVECFATHAPEGDDRTATVLSEWYLRLHRAAFGPEQSLPVVKGASPRAHALRGEQSTPPELPTPAALAEAMAVRYDPEQPFDGHSFGFFQPPSEPLELGARDWEALLERPAAVWLKAVAGVKPRTDFAEPVKQSLATGLAVHRLLALAPTEVDDGWRALDALRREWPRGIENAAYGWRRAVKDAYALAGQPVPPLWRELWGKILGLAQTLASGALAIERGNWLKSEHSLPRGAHLVLADGAELRLRGRVDALILDDPAEPRFALVLDYKTGSDKPLTNKRLEKGEGLQLVLYGGALADLWQLEIGLGLLKPNDPAEVQATIAPGADPSGLLAGLAQIGRDGIFGFGGEVRSEYAFVGDYPLSFFPPSAEIVERKWRLTHRERLPLPKGGSE